MSIARNFKTSIDWLLLGDGQEKPYITTIDKLINQLTESELDETEEFLEFIIYRREKKCEKKKAAQPEPPKSKETIYEYLPLIGRAAAGKPILIDEMVQGYIPVEARNHQFANCYLIEANGDSMTGEGIEDGDLVIVRPQPAVDNGDVTLVRIEDEAAIKYFFKENDVITLKSANPKYKPMTYSVTGNIAIIGKVIEKLKKDALNKLIIPESEERLQEYKKGFRVTVKNGKSNAG
jgi:repressor LexA